MPFDHPGVELGHRRGEIIVQVGVVWKRDAVRVVEQSLVTHEVGV